LLSHFAWLFRLLAALHAAAAQYRWWRALRASALNGTPQFRHARFSIPPISCLSPGHNPGYYTIPEEHRRKTNQRRSRQLRD